MPPQTMFQRYGGFDRVSGLVLAFYDRVLASERLRPFFRHTDMRRLIEHQAKFLSTVMGGPASYTDEQLRDLHAHLDIAPADFDEMLDHLRAAMAGDGFEEADIDTVMRRYGALRRIIATA